MKVLVLGASGATGKLVVHQLVKRDIQVRVVVRENAILPPQIFDVTNVEIVKGNISELDNDKIRELLKDCDSVVCCLGHNINFKGLFGQPRKLVYNAVKRAVEAIKAENKNIKFILMGTTAYTNKSIGETNTCSEKIIFSLLKIVLPPHKDNMLACDYLVYNFGSEAGLEWVAVRPDSLIDEEEVSFYEVFNRKTRSPISNPGKTSRINVSHFMAELVTNEKLWKEWKYKTPVIYNKE